MGFLKKIEANSFNFGILNRKLTSFDVVLEDLKKATQSKEENKAKEEIGNLKEVLTSLYKELNLRI
jgi:hypothetical protein